MDNLLIAIIIVSLASIIKGTTGFGFSLISLPLLSLFYDPKFLIPILSLSNLILSVIILLQKKTEYRLEKKYYSLIVLGVIGSIAGTAIYKVLPTDILVIVIGIATIIFSLLFLFGCRFKIKDFKRSTRIIGLICGLLAGSISVSGPPLSLFLTSIKNITNAQFREVFAWFSTMTAGISVAIYAYIGKLDWDGVLYCLYFLPIMWLCSFLGKRINRWIPVSLFQNIIILSCLLSGLSLLFLDHH